MQKQDSPILEVLTIKPCRAGDGKFYTLRIPLIKNSNEEKGIRKSPFG